MSPPRNARPAPAPRPAADPAQDAAPSPWGTARERARRRELKRDALVRAAAREFRDRGYHNTSLDDLARALHITKPTIYAYVGSKEELLFECFRAGVRQIERAFADTEGSSGSGRERLLAVARGYAVAVTSEFGWCMVRAEDLELGPRLSSRIRKLKSGIDQGLRRRIREGIADGSIRECDAKMAAFALAGALNWIAHWHRADAALGPDEIAARLLELFELGLAPR
jgi:AcrR family transcriptional regulator